MARDKKDCGKYPQGQGAAELPEVSVLMVPSILHPVQHIGRAGVTGMKHLYPYMKLVEMVT